MGTDRAGHAGVTSLLAAGAGGRAWGTQLGVGDCVWAQGCWAGCPLVAVVSVWTWWRCPVQAPRAWAPWERCCQPAWAGN